MRQKLRTEEGAQLYRKHQRSVEPAFWIIQQAIGFRQFLLGGIDKVHIEWAPVCLAYNWKRLFNLTEAAKAL